jgi:hypothetical protein
MNDPAVEEIIRISKKLEHKQLADDLRVIAAMLDRVGVKIRELYDNHSANAEQAINTARVARQWAAQIEQDGNNV